MNGCPGAALTCPAVYVAVEGETEYEIVRLLLNDVDQFRMSHEIEVVNLQGVGGDVRLLARSVAVPRLNPDGYRGARILSPLTPLVVVARSRGCLRNGAEPIGRSRCNGHQCSWIGPSRDRP